MKAQLILLDNPIIVTDEEIKDGDWYFYGNRFDIKELNQFKKGIDDTAFLKEQGIFKIISTNKPIDYNGIDFGIVDNVYLKELAEEEMKDAYGYFPNKPFYDFGFIKGFNASQQLNEKKFTSEDMRNMFILGGKHKVQNTNKFLDKMEEILLSLSLPKTFDIEIEETPTNIKIIKKL